MKNRSKKLTSVLTAFAISFGAFGIIPNLSARAAPIEENAAVAEMAQPEVSDKTLNALADEEEGATPAPDETTEEEEATPSPDETTEETLRNLTIEFMGRGETPQDTDQGKAMLTEADKNNIFWIGVAVDNIDDLELFTKGLYSLEIGFEYDSRYIVPADDKNSDWKGRVEGGNIASTNSEVTWTSDFYEVAETSLDVDLDVSDLRENKTDAETRAAETGGKGSKAWRMCTAAVRAQFGISPTNERFKGLDSGDKQYLIRLPFKLIDMPDLTANSDPKLLRIVLGAREFNIGAVPDGVDPYAEWIPDETVTENNLKPLFKFGGDISLFTTASGLDALEVWADATPTPEPTPTPDAVETPEPTSTPDAAETPDPSVTPTPEPIPTPEPTPYPLSQTDDMGEEGFENSHMDYYVSVPYDTEMVRLVMQAKVKPESVKIINDTYTTEHSISIKTENNKYLAIQIPLDLIPKPTTEVPDNTKIFNNTVVINVDGSEYTVHIRRLLKPEMVLAYGNSPYGEIMKAEKNEKGEDFTDEMKETAKEQFIAKVGSSKAGQFKAGYCPEGCDIKMYYSSNAWAGTENNKENTLFDSEKNLDMDETAVFIYQGESFQDPGYMLINEFGQDVTASSVVHIYMEVTKKSSGIRNMADNNASLVKNYVLYDKDVTTSEFVYSDHTKTYVRPDVYKIKYTCTINGTRVSAERNLVWLYINGDINIDGGFNNNDVSDIASIYKSTIKPYNGIDESNGCLAKSLYCYRILDINYDGGFNNNDVSDTAAKYKKTKKFSDYYRSLKPN